MQFTIIIASEQLWSPSCKALWGDINLAMQYQNEIEWFQPLAKQRQRTKNELKFYPAWKFSPFPKEGQLGEANLSQKVYMYAHCAAFW